MFPLSILPAASGWLPNSSTNGAVSGTHAVWRQNELTDAYMAAPECSRTLEQIIFPHPAEPFTVPAHHLGSVGLELDVPGHQRLVVEDAEIVNIFHDEEALDGCGDLAYGG